MTVYQTHANKMFTTPQERSYSSLIKEYQKTSEGAFRIFQAAEKSMKIAAHLFKEADHEFAGVAKDVGSKMGQMAGGMGLLRLTSVTQEAVEAVATAPVSLRGSVKLIDKTSDAVSTWAYAGLFFTGNSALADVAKFADAAGGVARLSTDYEDYALASHHLEEIRKSSSSSNEIVQCYSDLQRSRLIKVAKDVCSAVSAILGVMLLSFGGPVLPALVLMGIGLASTILAMGSWFFDATTAYDMKHCMQDLRTISRASA